MAKYFVLFGPPGVGKTSLGKSIARSLSREFIRVSLGGVRDEAEIRGHRRTYIGALPGRVIQGLRRVGTKNPVFMLDEIDTLETVPPALLDRMEVIELPGYTRDEKLEIAKRHLAPKQVSEHGLTASQIVFDDETITIIIEQYTREAGVRNLEREIANVIRGIAVKVAENESYEPKLTPEKIADLLGPQKFFSEIAERTEVPGVATGLAWMPSGGDILFIEASQMTGKGNLILTGHLGDVMKESARAALSWVRTHGDELGIGPDFEKVDIHLHVPAGAVSKDGPSAGVAMTVALASLFTGRRVRGDVAMTGEITLRGSVLPVGGIKEKVLAAHRAGIRRVVLPDRNRKDMVDIPESVRKDLELSFVKRIQDVLEQTLETVPVEMAGPGATKAPEASARA